MKLTASLVPLALCSLASASIFGGQAIIEDPDLSVPGDNPLNFCKGTDDYKLEIEYVDLLPNPPEAYAATSLTRNKMLILFQAAKTSRSKRQVASPKRSQKAPTFF